MHGDEQPVETVTAREAEVLAALSEGATNAEIAERLFISVRTVESHVSALLRKLGQPDRRALARVGARLGAGAAAVLPLPDVVTATASHGSFTGREEERATIERLLGRVASGGRQHLALVSGPAGIGKTRLVAEVAVALHPKVPAVAFGRCDEEGLVPYQPFVEGLGAFVEQLPAGVVERVRPALSLLSPVTRPGAPAAAVGEPVRDRNELLDAVEAILGSLPSPVMVIVDDLQWADQPSLQVIRHLLRGTRRLPVLLVATARPESLHLESPLARLLESLDPDSVTQIALDGLSEAQVVAMASCDFPEASALATEAWSRTDGNPLLVRELLRFAAEEGRSSLEVVAPRLRELVARRIARLDPALVQVFNAAALTGESFRLGLAARVAGLEPLDVLDGMESAVLAGFVEEVPGEPDRYRFSHALVRDALVQRLSSSRRLHLHLRIAEELERAGPEPNLAEVAYHRHAALPEGDPAAAAAAARAASERAAGALAYEQAAGLRGMALDALLAGCAGEAQEAEERLARAELLLKAGDTEAARADLEVVAEAAARLDDTDLLARAVLGMGEAAPRWGFDGELVRWLGTALDALGDGAPSYGARLTARLAQALYYAAGVERRRELSEQAESHARASGDPETLAWVLSARHDALWGPDSAKDRAETALKIAELGDELGHTELRIRGHALLAADLLEVGRVAEARAAAERHRELAAESRQPAHLRDAEVHGTMWAFVEGRLDEAEEAMIATRDLGEAAHDPHRDVLYWMQQCALAFARNRPRELEELAAAYRRLSDELPHVPAWRSALGAICARLDDRAGAAAVLELQAADGFAGVPRDGVWLNAVTHLAETCAYLGDRDRARQLHAMLRPYAHLMVVVDRGVFLKGSVCHYLGLLDVAMGNETEARGWLERALDLHESAGAVLLAQRTREKLAAL